MRALASLLALALTAPPAQEDEPGSDHPPVRFAEHVLPILRRHCFKCHGGGEEKSGLSLETRERLIQGGDGGEVVDLEHPRASRLLALVTGTSDDPELVMPPKGERLSANEIATLRLWIEQGAPYEAAAGVSERGRLAPLPPRRPEIPRAREGFEHPIDRILDAELRAKGAAFPPPSEDRTFVRRAHLDLQGVLPSPDTVEAFVCDMHADKRARLVARLLADDEAYAEHWITFWNDLLRNDAAGTGYIDGGRKSITQWLHAALRDNVPFDRFVAQLLDPVPGSEGFAYGIKWRGRVNASQIRELQFAQTTAQVFLGVNLKCASCHDSFVDSWKLADAYGFAAIVADAPLEMSRCDAPTGRTARARFLFPELGGVDPGAPVADRRKRLAGLVTDPANGRFARTIANRLFARLMGRGLVEPVDVMDNEPWSRDVLDALACALVDREYDLRSLIGLVATSRAYGAVAAPEAEDGAESGDFRGPAPKRLTAEEFLDAVWAVTGTAPGKPDVAIPPRGAGTWIWSDPAAAKAAPAGERVAFRRALKLDAPPVKADAVMTCDNAFTLLVNERFVAADTDWRTPATIDLLPYLRMGDNEILVVAENQGTEPNPAALWLSARIETESGNVWVSSDAGFEFSRTVPVRRAASFFAGPNECVTVWYWVDDQGAPCEWRPAAELAYPGGDVTALLAQAVRERNGESRRPARAAYMNADPLQAALGRPNREQVVSTRPSTLTTIEALDLTNGKILAETLARGAKNVLARFPGAPAALVDDFFLRALSRTPADAERREALDLLGTGPSEDAVADLLWALFMLPEFQTIR